MLEELRLVQLQPTQKPRGRDSDRNASGHLDLPDSKGGKPTSFRVSLKFGEKACLVRFRKSYSLPRSN